MTLSDKIRTEIKNMVGRRQIREEAFPKNRYNLTISKKKIEEVARYLKKSEGRLVHISVIDIGVDGFQVVYHYAFDHLERNLHFNLKVLISREDPHLPSLGEITEEAVWPEREMMDFTRVKFTGNPILTHLWLPYEWPNPVEGGFSKNESNNQMKEIPVTQNLRGGERSLILFGPYHPALIESVYWRLKVDGEEILDAEIKLGWNHRGIMKLFEDKSYRRALMISERICGICHISHTSAYTNAVEYLAGADLPPRARYLKTLLNEFERIHSHLLWFAVAMDLIGFKTLFMLALKLREEVMDIFEKISGHRRTTNCIQIGGIRFDISNGDLLHIEHRIKYMDKKTQDMIEWAQDNSIIRMRLEDIGILPYESSIRLGGVGPTARGSNCKIDVRWSDPFAAYGEEWTTWDVIVESGEDCLSRTMVRLKELLVSYDLCRQCIDYLKKNPGPFLTEMKNIPPGEGLGKNEAPRGELLYYVIADGTNVPSSIRVRTPSYRNNSLLPEMLRGYTIGDAPIVIGSIDPCMSCTDRLTRIEDVKTNTVTTVSLREIMRRRCLDG